MVTNRFRTIGFMQPKTRLNMHSQESPIFVFWVWVGGGWGRGFFFGCNQCVPTVFPIDSNQVLKMFPNLFLVAQHFGSTFVECAILGGSVECSKKWANQSSSFKTKQNKTKKPWAHAPSPCQAQSCEMIIVKVHKFLLF